MSMQRTIDERDVAPKSISYTVEFIVEKSGGVGPAFSAIPIDRAAGGIGFKLSANRKDTHTLALTFSPNPRPKKPANAGQGPRPASGRPDERELLQDLNDLKIQNAIQSIQ